MIKLKCKNCNKEYDNTDGYEGYLHLDDGTIMTYNMCCEECLCEWILN